MNESLKRTFRESRIDELPTFDIDLRGQGRSWGWLVRTRAGKCLLKGRERSRPEARYKAARALFQLLASPRRHGATQQNSYLPPEAK